MLASGFHDTVGPSRKLTLRDSLQAAVALDCRLQ
jgi:hypothetical protein